MRRGGDDLLQGVWVTDKTRLLFVSFFLPFFLSWLVVYQASIKPQVCRSDKKWVYLSRWLYLSLSCRRVRGNVVSSARRLLPTPASVSCLYGSPQPDDVERVPVVAAVGMYDMYVRYETATKKHVVNTMQQYKGVVGQRRNASVQC